MISSIIVYWLIATATVMDGLLAGLNVDRALVQMPAWRRVGAAAWAAYSRHADLGNGLLLYPIEAIGGTLLSLLAAIAYYLSSSAPRSASLPVYLAASLALAGLLTTIQAAPKMLSLRRTDDDLTALQRAFDSFEFWGAVRGIFQALAFVMNVWSLVAVLHGVA